MAPLNGRHLQPRNTFFVSWSASYKTFFIFGLVFCVVIVAALVTLRIKKRHLREYNQLAEDTRNATTIRDAVTVTTDVEAQGIVINDTLILPPDDVTAEELGKREPLFGTHALRAGQYTTGVVVCEETFRKPSRDSIFTITPQPTPDLGPKPEDDLVITAIPTGSPRRHDDRASLPSQVRRTLLADAPYTFDHAEFQQSRSDPSGDLADVRIEVMPAAGPASQTPNRASESSSTQNSRPTSSKATSVESAVSGSQSETQCNNNYHRVQDFCDLAESHRESMAAETGQFKRRQRMTDPVISRPGSQPIKECPTSKRTFERPKSARTESVILQNREQAYQVLSNGETPYLVPDLQSSSSLDSLANTDVFTTPPTSRPASIIVSSDFIDYDREDLEVMAEAKGFGAFNKEQPEPTATPTAALLPFREVNSGFSVGRGKKMDEYRISDAEIELSNLTPTGPNKLRKAPKAIPLLDRDSKKRSSIFSRFSYKKQLDIESQNP